MMSRFSNKLAMPNVGAPAPTKTTRLQPERAINWSHSSSIRTRNSSHSRSLSKACCFSFHGREGTHRLTRPTLSSAWPIVEHACIKSKKGVYWKIRPGCRHIEGTTPVCSNGPVSCAKTSKTSGPNKHFSCTKRRGTYLSRKA